MLHPTAPLAHPASRTHALPRHLHLPLAADYTTARQLVFPPPGHGFLPTGINDRGDIIGNLIHPKRFEGASWTAAGLYLPPHHYRNTGMTEAEMAHPFAALSSTGLVAGTCGPSAKRLSAWASHRPTFGQDYWPQNLSFAQGVNARGQVVGKMLLNADPILVSRAFLIGPDGPPRYFDAPEGGLTDAIAINDRGTVLFNVTALSTRTALQRAWLWRDETFIPLQAPPRCSSEAIALNASDQTVGFIETEFGRRRPVLWTDGQPLDLNTRDAQDFRPTCISDHGVIGGSALNSHADRAACIWTAGRGLQFLQDLQPRASGGNPATSGGRRCAAATVASAGDRRPRVGEIRIGDALCAGRPHRRHRQLRKLHRAATAGRPKATDLAHPQIMGVRPA